LKRSEAEILQEAFDAGIVLEKVEAIPYLYKIVDAGRNILQEYAKKIVSTTRHAIQSSFCTRKTKEWFHRIRSRY